MNTNEQLKPCPFCGGKAKLVTSTMYFTTFYVCCLSCKIRTRKYVTENEAIEAWNRRANE